MLNSDTSPIHNFVEPSKGTYPAHPTFSLIQFEITPQKVAILTLGRAEEGPITLSEKRMAEMELAFQVAQHALCVGLVIIGPRSEMFTVGADLSAIRKVTDSQEGHRLAKLGQAAFDKLQSLPFTTIAAISGPCVGGGYELALACKYRICSDHKTTMIGLPEIKLGILPGFGGCQRLPRLVGLPIAADLILNGKTVPAKTALTLGLVNEIVATHHLRSRAESIALGKVTPSTKKISIKDFLLTHTSPGRYLVQTLSNKALQKKGGTHYPAPAAALAVMLDGLSLGHHYGLEREAQEIGRLVTSDVSKSLVRLFFLTEEAKSIGKRGDADIQGMHGLVIGAGVMGRGIAEICARRGVSVTLKDIDSGMLQKARAEISNRIKGSTSLSASEQDNVIDRIAYTTDDNYQLGPSNIAIEAIVEKIELKAKVLGALAERLPTGSIIASNTSSLSINEMAQSVRDPANFIGMHFFNPVAKMPLVEIIRGKLTSEKTIVITAALAKKLGKIPIVVEDSPGFLINRILSPYLNAAVLMLTKGYSVRAIDGAALSFGLPMGPLRLLDEVGHDVAHHVGEIMHKGFGDRLTPFSLSQCLVEEGALGKKTNKGIYLYSNKSSSPRPDITTLVQAPPAPMAPIATEQLHEVLILPMIQEAVRCHDDGIAGNPGAGAAGQIDLGSIMGLGFPAFTGGILQYASSLGAARILEKLKFYREEFDSSLFDAPEGIISRAKNGKSFYESP
jgi:3-hydroxyacyl-CoA dehydrogenase/enoyl-CoA hydratase/3-hydroxybutyryl-CoA epimerase